MPARRNWLMLALGAAIVVGAYLFSGSGDEQRVVDVLRELMHAAQLEPGEPAEPRRARIAQSFGTYLEPDVLLDVPELPGAARGSAAVQALAVDLAQRYSSVRFRIEQSEIHVTERGAEVSASVTLFAADRESELRDTRHVTLALTRAGDGFRVASVKVGSRSREEPEARP